MFDKIFLGFLALFLVLFGIAAVTNLQIVWMEPVTGIAALIAGVIGIVRAVR